MVTYSYIFKILIVGLLQQLRSNAVCVEEDLGGEEEEISIVMATECVDNIPDKVPLTNDPHTASMATNNTYPSNTITTADSSVHMTSSPLADSDVTHMSSGNSDRTEIRTPVSPGLNNSGPNHASGSAFVTGQNCKVKQLKRKNTPASLPTVNKLNGEYYYY